MVQVINGTNPKGQLSEMLGMSLGSGIGNGLNTYFANRSLESVMKDKSLTNAPQSRKLEALRSALSPYGEKGQEILQQRMMIEQQEQQENQQGVLSRVLSGEKVPPKDLSRLTPENQLKVMELQKKREIGKSVYDSLIKSGYPDETAKIWQNQMENAPVGGQSDVIKNVNDLIRRSQPGKGVDGQDNAYNENQDIKNIVENQDQGLSPSERVKRESERFKIGQPIREEAATKIRGFSRDKERLAILDSLNKSGKLPKDFGLLNVDKEGNLRLPFVATPEAQRYMKTLNEFSSSAKDTFGSRVTNFDLTQFLKRFPTLLNTEEGRRQISDQMKIVNEINTVHYKNLQDVFREAGGARKIDSDIAEDIAERRSEKTIDELVKKFDEIGQFASQPSANEFKGRKIRDKKTGQILISDGQNWIPEK